MKVWTAALVLYAIFISSGQFGFEITRVVNDIAWTVAAILAAISSYRAAISLQGRDRSAWLIFALACASWAAGQLVWNIYELYLGIPVPYPSYADMGYLAFGPLMILGLFVLRATQQERSLTWLRVANFGLILCSLSSVLITTFAEPFDQTQRSLGSSLIVVAENATIVVAFVLAIYFLWSYRWGDRLLSYTLITLSLVAQMVAGLLYTRELIVSDYDASSYFYIGWLVAFALHQWAAEAQVSAKASGREESMPMRQSQGLVEAVVPSFLLLCIALSASMLAEELTERVIHLRTLLLVAFSVILASREAWLYLQGQQLRFALDNSANSLTRARERLNAVDAQRRDLERVIEATSRAGSVGLWEWEPATNAVRFSREWKRQLGYDEHEVPDSFEEWSKRLHPADYARVIGELERFLRHPDAEFISEQRLRHRDGSYRWMLSQASALLDADGRPSRMLGSTVDITPFKHLEQSLRVSEGRYRDLADALEGRVAQRTKELSEAYRESRNYAHAVAHDLKAPLRAINGFCALLEQSAIGKLSAEERTYIERARQGAMRMATLIDDLLNYSRVEHREQRLRPIDCQVFVEDLIDEMSEAIRDVSAAIHLNVDSTPVLADREGLRIALANLLQNALKFSKHNPQPRIVIESHVEAGRYLLQVRDNGIGFDPEYRDKIFEIFNRLHASGYEGTGIGLALVRKAVQRMEGDVWAEAAPGAGATFFVSLKLAAPATPSNHD
ncbi:ATP-binding protein [Steroidobacter sp.]|uniref:ATP-binding protein n=1 Tax=Steroidobacter sp. TaxID=1978227 RepID=UPI001A5FDC50|nr:ATP-binding protein [Steroidobacter sp.]MBL8271635.1 PAS domain-containing protein [Steroidobacter sp.]